MAPVVHSELRNAEMADRIMSVQSIKQQAQALLEQNRPVEARELYEQACRSNPADADAWAKLGHLNLRLGAYAGAERCCRRALDLEPGHAGVIHALGVTLQRLGRVDEAIACYRQAASLSPDHVEAHYFLANALRERGDTDAALPAYRTVIRLQPDHAGALNNLGLLHLHHGEVHEAIDLLTRALCIRPDSPEMLTNLGDVYLAIGRHERASAKLREAIRIRPEFFDAHKMLGDVLHSQGRFDEALAAYREALGIRPDAPEILLSQAQIFGKLGRHEQAYAVLQPFLAADEVDVAVGVTFFDISGHIGRRAEAVELLQQLLTRAGLPDAAASAVRFRLGGYYDGEGLYDQAFAQFRAANALRRSRFDVAAMVRRFNDIIRIYNRGFVQDMKRAANRSPRPLFIVGMPRSGTTLVEQILSRHPSVYAAGERTDIPEAIDRLSAGDIRRRPFPGFVADLDQHAIDAAAGRYMETLNGLSAEAARITNKMPQNFVFLGLIAQLCPGARIIHCVRNPLDTCLSCYFQDFGNLVHEYAYDLATLGAYHAQYQRLMRHWEEVLPLPMLQLVYEDLVHHQEDVSRRMLEFCGLDWDERCLSFHESSRIVHTLSYEQVRQPMYSRSVGRWKNYEQYLGPLKAALEGASGR